MQCRLGIDVGGTFTDLYLLNEDNNQQFTLKLPSTPSDPSDAIVSGLATLLERHNISPKDVTYLAHGTTVATNTIVQHAGARVGMVTTKGFRDLLEIGRQKRPSVYDLFADKPLVLVPRHLRREIDERMAYDGTIVREISIPAITALLTDLLGGDIDAIAVCFLHSYANPAHELLVKELAAQMNGGIYLSVSHELTSEFREFERFLTAVLNAYVGTKVAQYFSRLRTSLLEMGVTIDPHIIQSNGGLMSIRAAADAPVRTVLSGPSAGVVGAAYEARRAGIPNIIAFDMGGTSTDVSLLRDAQPSMATNQTIAGYPIRIPAIAIHTIGAGGGSIAWTDDAMGFHVGPRSAGAVPGPAAYGLGGEEPTVTDANVLLGRLNQTSLLGGEMPVYPKLAEKAMDQIAERLNLSREQTAAGLIQIAVSAMVRAVRVISVEKGEDPRDFALIAFGGAGALHASAVARQLGIEKICVPAAPGLLCSLGALLAVPTMEYARTKVLAAHRTDEIKQIFAQLKIDATEWLVHEGVAEDLRRLRCSVDMRYVGQNYELTVVLPTDRTSSEDLDQAVLSFHQEHKKHFGYASANDAVQVVACRVVANGVGSQIEAAAQTTSSAVAVPRTTRPVFFETTASWTDCNVYAREDLHAGAFIAGPAIIEQLDTTTVLYPDDAATVDNYGNIMITVGLEAKDYGS